MSVLVMGATGNVGGAIVEALNDQGVPVRAVSRSEREWPEGVEGFVGDPGDPDGLTAAATGATGVFLMSGYAAEATLLDALDDARVVVLSASAAPLGAHGNAVGGYHLASEQAVQASGLDWTVLRPCSFQSNLLGWNDQLERGDVVRVPFGDVPTAMIDPTDVGAVAATTLTAGGHAGRTLRLSGPQALTPTDQLELLATALDRPLRLEAVSDNEARGAIPEGYADVLLEIFRSQPALESEVQPTVEQVLGRPPRPLADWIEPTGKPSCELAEYRAADSHPAAPWQLVGRIRARPHRLRGLATDRADGSLNQPQDRDERARDMYAPGPDHGDKRAVACRGGRL